MRYSLYLHPIVYQLILYVALHSFIHSSHTWFSLISKFYLHLYIALSHFCVHFFMYINLYLFFCPYNFEFLSHNSAIFPLNCKYIVCNFEFKSCSSDLFSQSCGGKKRVVRQKVQIMRLKIQLLFKLYLMAGTQLTGKFQQFSLTVFESCNYQDKSLLK